MLESILVALGGKAIEIIVGFIVTGLTGFFVYRSYKKKVKKTSAAPDKLKSKDRAKKLEGGKDIEDIYNNK